MLQIGHVQYWYRPGRTVLEDISFSVERGEIVCLLGPNGTGKTTLLRCILGLHRPKQGHVLVDGRDLAQLPARERAKRMAYVPQSSALAFPYEVREVVLMGRVSHLSHGAGHREQDRQAAAQALERLEISHLARRKFQELSGGERQMVLVARALSQESDLLVMDEPTANLDYSNQVKILKTILSLSREGYGILMTSHYPDHAFLACTKAVLMRDGRVMAQGRPDEVVTSQSLTRLYDTPVEVAEALAAHEKVKVCVPLLDAQGRVYIEETQEETKSTMEESR